MESMNTPHFPRLDHDPTARNYLAEAAGRINQIASTARTFITRQPRFRPSDDSSDDVFDARVTDGSPRDDPPDRSVNIRINTGVAPKDKKATCMKKAACAIVTSALVIAIIIIIFRYALPAGMKATVNKIGKDIGEKMEDMTATVGEQVEDWTANLTPKEPDLPHDFAHLTPLDDHHTSGGIPVRTETMADCDSADCKMARQRRTPRDPPQENQEAVNSVTGEQDSPAPNDPLINWKDVLHDAIHDATMTSESADLTLLKLDGNPQDNETITELLEKLNQTTHQALPAAMEMQEAEFDNQPDPDYTQDPVTPLTEENTTEFMPEQDKPHIQAQHSQRNETEQTDSDDPWIVQALGRLGLRIVPSYNQRSIRNLEIMKNQQLAIRKYLHQIQESALSKDPLYVQDSFAYDALSPPPMPQPYEPFERVTRTKRSPQPSPEEVNLLDLAKSVIARNIADLQRETLNPPTVPHTLDDSAGIAKLRNLLDDRIDVLVRQLGTVQESVATLNESMKETMGNLPPANQTQIVKNHTHQLRRIAKVATNNDHLIRGVSLEHDKTRKNLQELKQDVSRYTNYLKFHVPAMRSVNDTVKKVREGLNDLRTDLDILKPTPYQNEKRSKRNVRRIKAIIKTCLHLEKLIVNLTHTINATKGEKQNAVSDEVMNQIKALEEKMKGALRNVASTVMKYEDTVMDHKQDIHRLKLWKKNFTQFVYEQVQKNENQTKMSTPLVLKEITEELSKHVTGNTETLDKSKMDIADQWKKQTLQGERIDILDKNLRAAHDRIKDQQRQINTLALSVYFNTQDLESLIKKRTKRHIPSRAGYQSLVQRPPQTASEREVYRRYYAMALRRVLAPLADQASLLLQLQRRNYTSENVDEVRFRMDFPRKEETNLTNCDITPIHKTHQRHKRAAAGIITAIDCYDCGAGE